LLNNIVGGAAFAVGAGPALANLVTQHLPVSSQLREKPRVCFAGATVDFSRLIFPGLNRLHKVER